MIKWKRKAAGDYVSSGGRFEIAASYDRIYGDHWLLRDLENPDPAKAKYHEQTLLDCKFAAEEILSADNRKEKS